MRVRVVAFARLAEVLGWTRQDVTLQSGASTADAWAQLERQTPALRPLAESSRMARNGRLIAMPETLEENDELALLPPVGGG